MNSSVAAIWLIIGVVHLGIPIVYFARMKRVSRIENNYRLSLKDNYQPSISVLVPTYNEASVIAEKIRNLVQIDYPREKLEIVVIDGGSTDRTARFARDALEDSGLQGFVIEEERRGGKSAGLNRGLKAAKGELICISDAECKWERRSLANAVKYFSDPSVGSVSGVHRIQNPDDSMATKVEDSYRSIYQDLRIGESKIHSTPVAEGELQLFRRSQLEEFDTHVGGDDTDAALVMVSKGFRAISAEDVIFYEPTPRSWRERFRQKTRRGQHVLQAFLKHRNLLFSRKNPFSRVVFPMEFFLYTVNPLLLLPFLVLTVWLVTDTPILSYSLLVGLGIILGIPIVRQTGLTYLTSNLTMLGAIVQEARGTKQLQWTKIEETRHPKRVKIQGSQN